MPTCEACNREFRFTAKETEMDPRPPYRCPKCRPQRNQLMGKNAQLKIRVKDKWLDVNEMHDDIRTLCAQLDLMEHAQNQELIKSIRKKYGIKSRWEE